MRKIIRPKKTPPKLSVEPEFDVLNGFFKSMVTGDNPEVTQRIKSSIEFWQQANCGGDDCEGCLLNKYQRWIYNANFYRVKNLCTLMEKLLNDTLRVNKCTDIMNTGIIVPGSFESR